MNDIKTSFFIVMNVRCYWTESDKRSLWEFYNTNLLLQKCRVSSQLKISLRVFGKKKFYGEVYAS